MNVRLRLVSTAGDAELVRRWKERPELKDFSIDAPDRPGELIEVDGEPAGWIDPHAAYGPAWQDALGPRVGDHPWTLDLFVLPDHRGRGIAREAIRIATERCLEDAATSMVVNVERRNEASRRAFEAAGWELVETTDEEHLLTYPPRKSALSDA